MSFTCRVVRLIAMVRARRVLLQLLATALCSQLALRPAFAQAGSSLEQANASAATAKHNLFEVVVIHPSDPHVHGWKMEFTPTGFTARNVTLRSLTQEAFDAYEPGHLVGGPNWFDKAAYDIEAKIDVAEQPDFRALTLPARRAMLKDVLQKRFQLQTHPEDRYLQGLALAVAKGGAKLRKTAETAQVHGNVLGLEGLITESGPGLLEGAGLSCTQLSSLLAGYLDRNVIDKTGLTDRYDIALHWNPSEAAMSTNGDDSEGAGLPSLYTALQEQLGLRLEATKNLASVIVVEKAEIPDAN